MRSPLLSVDDFSDDEIEPLLEVATRYRALEHFPLPTSRPYVVGLLFLEASLRTRVGFAVAAARLGWASVDVAGQRQSPTSMAESWDDTLRTLSGYADIVVARPAVEVAREELTPLLESPFINAGDVGPRAEHPTQALIDMFAIETLLGPVGALHVAICGDIRMRVARSFLKLLGRRPPGRLSVITPSKYFDSEEFPRSLTPAIDRRRLPELDDVDVLYVTGMPHESLAQNERQEFIVDERAVARMPPAGVVLSPLPVIDEIDEAARRDSRVKMFWQSDQGLWVRMALLSEMIKHDAS